jgi:hypothetical protein
MTAISSGIGNSPVLYAVLSALNMLLITACSVAGTALLFRLRPRSRWYLWALAAVLSLAFGGLRPWAFGTSLQAVQAWNVATTLLPYLCALFLYPIKSVWKALLVSLGYEFVAAVKYVILLLFFNYDNDDVNDPLELMVELLLGVAVLLLLVFLVQRLRAKDEAFSVTRTGVTLYLLIVATVVVLSVSLSLLGSHYTEEDHAQFAFTLLNIPLFAATASYAALSVSKSRQQERAYKEQLNQQIRHYEMMEQMNEDLREFRHDLPKMLRPFAAYVENDDSAAAKEIAQKLSGFTAEHGVRFHTGNYRLDTVLFCQQQIAQKDDITINYVFGSVFPAEGIDPDDLYVIFPNALDNAIEACRKVEGPREITITSKIVGGEVLVTITNPVAETVRTYGGLPQTSKRDTKRHGYGFRSMKKAAAKYGGDNLDFRVENGMFILRFNLRFQPDGTV